MPSEEQTMQIRKFLKRVGVESHTALDEALRSAEGPVSVTVTLVVEGKETTQRVFSADIDAE